MARWPPIPLLVAVALVLAACAEGDDSGDEAPPTPTAESPAAGAEADATDPPTETGTAGATGGSASGIAGDRDDYEPGETSFRLAHFAPDAGPLDMYVFTSQGLVERYEYERGVEFGTILDDVRPPADGRIVAFPGGTTDLDTIHGPDVVLDIGTAASEANGPERTVVLSPGDDADGIDVTEYWESPDPGQVGTYANALPPAVDGEGLLLLAHDAGERTPVRPAVAGGDGCLAPRDASEAGLWVGGTVVLDYAVTGPTELTFHSFEEQDTDCAGTPVLSGSVDVAAGERLLVVLYDDGSGLAAHPFDLP